MASAAGADSLPVPAAVAGPAASSRAVYTGLRPLRTVAMLSIVGFHVSWEPPFGVAFGLTCLQTILCALATRRPRSTPLAPFARRRAKRLLVPWVFWSSVYALFEIVRAWHAGQPLFGRLEGCSWASGASFHLWFLPFAFCASVAANRLQSVFERQPARGSIATTALFGVALVLAAVPLGVLLTPPMPFGMWLDGAATIAFGLAIGRSLALEDPGERRASLTGVAALALLPWLLSLHVVDPSPLFTRYAVAVPLAVLGFLVRAPESRVLGTLASCNLGVYLVHMLVIRLVDHVPGVNEVAALPHTLLVYLACLGVVYCVRRLRVPYVA